MLLPRTLLHKSLSFAGLLALLALAVPSCINPPNYSDTPEIEFRDIEVVRVESPRGAFDNVTITIGYRDGDGDLGLDLKDETPPFNPTLPDGKPNPTFNNYFCQLQIRQSDGSFIDFSFPGVDGRSDGRFPILTPASQEDRKAPIRGDINYDIRLSFNSALVPGDVLRYKVTILDRALNRSNEVVTNSFTLLP